MDINKLPEKYKVQAMNKIAPGKKNDTKSARKNDLGIIACPDIQNSLKTQILTLDFKLPSLNDYVEACRTHWSKGASFKKKIERDIIFEAKASKIQRITGPCVVYIDYQEKNKMRDVDNVYSANKYVLDALVTAGVLENDNPKCVRDVKNSIGYGSDYKITIKLEKI